MNTIDELKQENARLRLLLAQHGINDHPASVEQPADRPSTSYEHDHTLPSHLIERYGRQIILPAFGVHGAVLQSVPRLRHARAGQAALHQGAVLIVGAGGLGCPVAQYLAAAGVGRLGIVDRDAVDRSNLHRQVLHREADVGRHKALSAADACLRINSNVKVEVHTNGLTPANALDIVTQYDVVVDASDNPPTRYLIRCAACPRP